jgi:hypothetical protein
MDLAAFRTSFPEFAATLDATVEAKLAEAARRVDARVFGDKESDAVGYLAAHLIATAPGGQHARLEGDSTQTTYGLEWMRLCRMCAGGPWAIGAWMP